MSEPDLALVREFKRRAEAALPGRVARVVLYGSRARNEARPDSDWDVAVFVRGKPTTNDRDTLSDIGFDLLMEHGQYIQPIALDLARAGEESWFVENVERDGIAA
ncbi:nucleotidyltransferase domain-containing protein [Reyranella sp. CPCC 100927]|uniref:nucleotidyltransferase domain-containing protein n=1 Tax=Reyranella sp. CPCC 100927 TaxID=2599616 RepID=UPI0011B7896F|nr:nucleotidyltransferase domain-containing protein [Reyranella sp. CPCC 100927]TWT02114.1 nucleotidyltransferase domain-containing protein [Reyranella sp. CPCC 100927]